VRTSRELLHFHCGVTLRRRQRCSEGLSIFAWIMTAEVLADQITW
jgi:hypothetical protein